MISIMTFRKKIANCFLEMRWWNTFFSCYLWNMRDATVGYRPFLKTVACREFIARALWPAQMRVALLAQYSFWTSLLSVSGTIRSTAARRSRKIKLEMCHYEVEIDRIQHDCRMIFCGFLWRTWVPHIRMLLLSFVQWFEAITELLLSSEHKKNSLADCPPYITIRVC